MMFTKAIFLATFIAGSSFVSGDKANLRNLGYTTEECDEMCDDGDACTIDYLTSKCKIKGKCLPEPRPQVNCDDGNVCTIDSCDPAEGCVYEDKNCDDGDPCTIDFCCPILNPESGCVNKPKWCPKDKVCDTTTGQCTAITEVAPCVAVADEWDAPGDSNLENLWNEFRAEYPKRPFCLLVPMPQSGGTRYIPTNFADDNLSPDSVDRTTHADVSRDEGNPASASDWFDICGLADYTSGANTINCIGLFIDTSGSMTLSTVEASYDLFMETLNDNGLEYDEVHHSNENWIQPFITELCVG